MIAALLLLIGAAVWLIVAIWLARWVSNRTGLRHHRRWVFPLLVPVLLFMPFADEWIGGWQFKRLCAREAVVRLSPDWNSVKRARENELEISHMGMQEGYAIRIKKWRKSYTDMDTGKVFYETSAFSTDGGVLLGRFRPYLGTLKSCSPPDDFEAKGAINMGQLIKNGKGK